MTNVYPLKNLAPEFLTLTITEDMIPESGILDINELLEPEERSCKIKMFAKNLKNLKEVTCGNKSIKPVQFFFVNCPELIAEDLPNKLLSASFTLCHKVTGKNLPTGIWVVFSQCDNVTAKHLKHLGKKAIVKFEDCPKASSEDCKNFHSAVFYRCAKNLQYLKNRQMKIITFVGAALLVIAYFAFS